MIPYGPTKFTVQNDAEVWTGPIVYTNRQVLHIIGSTIASHFDVDEHPLIGVLQSAAQRNQLGLTLDTLSNYVCHVAEIAINLCEQIVSKSDQLK